jgi:hypothetical protein
MVKIRAAERISILGGRKKEGQICTGIGDRALQNRPLNILCLRFRAPQDGKMKSEQTAQACVNAGFDSYGFRMYPARIRSRKRNEKGLRLRRR